MYIRNSDIEDEGALDKGNSIRPIHYTAEGTVEDQNNHHCPRAYHVT